jgi:hypothetical protein
MAGQNVMYINITAQLGKIQRERPELNVVTVSDAASLNKVLAWVKNGQIFDAQREAMIAKYFRYNPFKEKKPFTTIVVDSFGAIVFENIALGTADDDFVTESKLTATDWNNFADINRRSAKFGLELYKLTTASKVNPVSVILTTLTSNVVLDQKDPSCYNIRIDIEGNARDKIASYCQAVVYLNRVDRITPSNKAASKIPTPVWQAVNQEAIKNPNRPLMFVRPTPTWTNVKTDQFGTLRKDLPYSKECAGNTPFLVGPSFTDFLAAFE